VRRKMVAPTMALRSVCSLCLLLFLSLQMLRSVCLSLIQYDRQALLDVFASICTDFFLLLITGVRAVDPLSLGQSAVTNKQPEEEEANVPEFYADPDETPQPATAMLLACKCSIPGQ